MKEKEYDKDLKLKEMKMILIRNIQAQLDKKRIKQTDMARDLNFPFSTVSNWMKGETYPRPDRIQEIADYFNVKRSDLTEDKPTNIIEISQRTVRVPILGPIACGDPILVEENYENYRTVLAESLPSGNTVYLEAKGDSMHPTIPNGAMVLIREQSDVENGEIAAVTFNGNTEATLKRVKKQGNMIVLMPDNPEHEPIFVTEDNPVKIIGKAVKLEQDL